MCLSITKQCKQSKNNISFCLGRVSLQLFTVEEVIRTEKIYHHHPDPRPLLGSSLGRGLLKNQLMFIKKEVNLIINLSFFDNFN